MIQNYSTASLIERFPCPAGVDNNCVNFDVSGALCEEIKDQKEAQKENCDLSENWKSERKSEIRKAEKD